MAAAVVGLHVLDDNFLQPQPGTSAGDHLVSCLVPLACLGLGAAVYGRVRPGLRGAIALMLGFFGVLAGTEAFHYTRAVGPSGDDYTGLLSILAGLLLIGVGAVTLWRARRRDDRLWWRYGRRALLAAGAALLAFSVLFPVALAYVVTHASRAQVPAADLGAAYELPVSEALRVFGVGRVAPDVQHQAGGERIALRRDSGADCRKRIERVVAEGDVEGFGERRDPAVGVGAIEGAGKGRGAPETKTCRPSVSSETLPKVSRRPSKLPGRRSSACNRATSSSMANGLAR